MEDGGHLFNSNFIRDFYPQEADLVQDLFTNLSSSAEPEMVGQSSLLSPQQVTELNRQLPARCLEHPWTLAFSTALDGFSLGSLYRAAALEKEGPCLLVLREIGSMTSLGALLSHSPRVSKKFFGTGESWLFTYKSGALCLHTWTGANSCIIKGSSKSLVVGSDSDGFGLWLDEDLHHGSSRGVKTFGSGPLASQQDFEIDSLELWTFG